MASLRGEDLVMKMSASCIAALSCAAACATEAPLGVKEAPALRGDVGPEIKFDVASTDSTQIGGDVASDERDFFVVWIEPTDSGNTVYGARVAANGRVLDPEGLPLIEGVSSSLQPAVAFGDGNYLVAAGTPLRDNVTYVRVSTGGDVLDATPGMVQIDRLTTTSALDAAFDGKAFVLVATQYVVAFELDLYAARIASNGTVATEPFLVSNAGQGQLHARVAGNGAGTLVVWTDDRNRQEAPYDRAILGKQISEAGEVGAEITIAPFSHFYGAPGVVSLGTDYLVAWGDQRSADPGEGIYATKVAASGAVVTVGGAQIAAGTRYDFPAVAPTPDGYLVVWRHFDGTLEGRFLTVAGAPSGAGFPVSTAETTDGPALAANGMSRALAVYARNDSSTRVRGRIIATVDNMDPVDAGPRVDASRPGDAAVPDAAAMSRDAGAPDAETRVTPDATRPDAGRSLDGGDDGGCTVARGGVCGGALTWLLVGAALCSRRRRGRSP